MRLFHLIDPAAWAAARAAGEYRPDSLANEGFVHFSLADQVAGSANRHYADAGALVAVEFDPAALPDALRLEDSYGSGTSFPHLYAPVPTAAARTVHPLTRDADGRWTFSPDGAGVAASPDH